MKMNIKNVDNIKEEKNKNDYYFAQYTWCYLKCGRIGCIEKWCTFRLFSVSNIK